MYSNKNYSFAWFDFMFSLSYAPLLDSGLVVQFRSVDSKTEFIGMQLGPLLLMRSSRTHSASINANQWAISQWISICGYHCVISTDFPLLLIHHRYHHHSRHSHHRHERCSLFSRRTWNNSVIKRFRATGNGFIGWHFGFEIKTWLNIKCQCF